MSRSPALSKTINDLATETWKPTSPYWYSEWETHWLKTAESVRQDMIGQGLHASADWVKEEIAFNHSHSFAGRKDFLVSHITGKIIEDHTASATFWEKADEQV